MLLLALIGLLLAVPAVVVFLAGVRSPTGVPLLVYAAIIPFGSGFVVPVGLPSPFNTASTLAGAWLILSLMLHLVLYRERRNVLDRAALLWLSFLGWTAATVLWGVDPSASADHAVVLASLVVSYLLLSATGVDARRLRNLETAIVAGGVACGAYGLVLLAQGHFGVIDGVVQRFATAGGVGELADPGVTAASLLLPLTLALRNAVLVGRHRVVAAASATVIFAGILLTGSRGGLLASAVAVIFVLVAGRSYVSRRTVLTFASFLVVGVVAFAPASIVDRIQGQSPTAASSTSDVTTGRDAIWTVGLRSCHSYCLYGAGIAGFPEVYRQTIAGNFDIVGHGTKDYKAHNIALALLIETGIVGLLVAGTALVATYRSIRRQPVVLRAGARAGLVAVVAANMFVSNFDFKYFWLAITYVALVATRPLNRPVADPDVPATVGGFESPDSSVPRRIAGAS